MKIRKANGEIESIVKTPIKLRIEMKTFVYELRKHLFIKCSNSFKAAESFVPNA